MPGLGAQAGPARAYCLVLRLACHHDGMLASWPGCCGPVVSCTRRARLSPGWAYLTAAPGGPGSFIVACGSITVAARWLQLRL